VSFWISISTGHEARPSQTVRHVPAEEPPTAPARRADAPHAFTAVRRRIVDHRQRGRHRNRVCVGSPGRLVHSLLASVLPRLVRSSPVASPRLLVTSSPPRAANSLDCQAGTSTAARWRRPNHDDHIRHAQTALTTTRTDSPGARVLSRWVLGRPLRGRVCSSTDGRRAGSESSNVPLSRLEARREVPASRRRDTRAHTTTQRTYDLPTIHIVWCSSAPL
jgi:hypothetical protein